MATKVQFSSAHHPDAYHDVQFSTSKFDSVSQSEIFYEATTLEDNEVSSIYSAFHHVTDGNCKETPLLQE